MSFTGCPVEIKKSPIFMRNVKQIFHTIRSSALRLSRTIEVAQRFNEDSPILYLSCTVFNVNKSESQNLKAIKGVGHVIGVIGEGKECWLDKPCY